MKKLFSFSVFFSLLFLFYFNALADVPQMINYQGKLTTPAGAPVNDTLQMVFPFMQTQVAQIFSGLRPSLQ